MRQLTANDDRRATNPSTAAPPQSQGFMLVGTLFIIPFILGYTFWSYYVFRGKVTDADLGRFAVTDKLKGGPFGAAP